MPQRTLSRDIQKIKNLFISFVTGKKSNKYKVKPEQALYDEVIKNIENGATTSEGAYSRIINDKELKSLLNKEVIKDGVKTSVSALFNDINKERSDKLKILSGRAQVIADYVIALSRAEHPLSYEKIMTDLDHYIPADHVIALSRAEHPLSYEKIMTDLDHYIPSIEEWNKIFMIKVMDGKKETTLRDLLDSIKLKESTNLSQQQQRLSSRRGSNASVVSNGSNASFYSAKTSFDDYGKQSLRKQYPVLPPIVANDKIEAAESFTKEKYEAAIKKIETDNNIKKLSDAYGVKINKNKEELAGTTDFTSSIGGLFGGNIFTATSFSGKCEDNFNTCKKNYATMLPFCHIKDIMDLKTKNQKLHDALSDSEFSASLFLTDKTVKLNTPESLNAVYNDLKNDGLNKFNTIAGDILSGAQKQDNKEMSDILDANIKFYSDDNVDKNGKKYSTKSQEATNKALEFKICKDIIIELVLKNPDAMQNINIMICGEKELKEYADKAGTSFNNGNIKKLFVEKMPQKIQEWQKWIELGKDIDCDKYPEFAKFKANINALLDKELSNGKTWVEKKEAYKYGRHDKSDYLR